MNEAFWSISRAPRRPCSRARGRCSGANARARLVGKLWRTASSCPKRRIVSKAIVRARTSGSSKGWATCRPPNNIRPRPTNRSAPSRGPVRSRRRAAPATAPRTSTTTRRAGRRGAPRPASTRRRDRARATRCSTSRPRRASPAKRGATSPPFGRVTRFNHFGFRRGNHREKIRERVALMR